MTYTPISEKHNIWSCAVDELTIEDAENIVAVPSGGTLKTAVGFVNTENGKLILNSEHEDYYTTADQAFVFFERSKDEQREFVKQNPDALVSRAHRIRVGIHDAYIVKYEKMLRGVDLDFIDHEETEERLLLDGKKVPLWQFRYGFIQGKRAERARRKKKACR